MEERLNGFVLDDDDLDCVAGGISNVQVSRNNGPSGKYVFGKSSSGPNSKLEENKNAGNKAGNNKGQQSKVDDNKVYALKNQMDKI